MTAGTSEESVAFIWALGVVAGVMICVIVFALYQLRRVKRLDKSMERQIPPPL